VTKAQSNHHRASLPAGRNRHAARRLCGLMTVGLLLLSGCGGGLFQNRYSVPDASTSTPFWPWENDNREPMSLEQARVELDKARSLFDRKEYAQAKKEYYTLSMKKKMPPTMAEEALFYEAECERLRKRFPEASEIYLQLLNNYPRNRFQKQTLQNLFDIANYWLDETREVVKEQKEHRDGKRKVVWPVALVHFDDSKPFLDMQGHAMAILEKVYLTDIDGPLGEKSLSLLGDVNLFQGNYEEADHFYGQILKYHPNGPFATKAMEMSIVCKQMSARGSEYDGRTTADARQLVHRAKTAFPELANDKNEFLQKQLQSITLQQAQKDMGIAEFYERTKHPGSAYFYYELVRRRYPGTEQAKIATQRMAYLKERAEREQNGESTGLFGLPRLFAKKTDVAPPPKQRPAEGPMLPANPPQRPPPTPMPYQQPEQLPAPRPVPGAGGATGYGPYAPAAGLAQPTGYSTAGSYPPAGYPTANTYPQGTSNPAATGYPPPALPYAAPASPTYNGQYAPPARPAGSYP
jgi:outer membrane protein assembly factor BamD (BamD/ComL family)